MKRTGQSTDQTGQVSADAARNLVSVEEPWRWDLFPATPAHDAATSSPAPSRRPRAGGSSALAVLSGALTVGRLALSLAHGGAPLDSAGWGVHLCDSANFFHTKVICTQDDTLVALWLGDNDSSIRSASAYLQFSGRGGAVLSGPLPTISVTQTSATGRVIARGTTTTFVSRHQNVVALPQKMVLDDAGIRLKASLVGSLDFVTYHLQVRDGTINLGSASVQTMSPHRLARRFLSSWSRACRRVAGSGSTHPSRARTIATDALLRLSTDHPPLAAPARAPPKQGPGHGPNAAPTRFLYGVDRC